MKSTTTLGLEWSTIELKVPKGRVIEVALRISDTDFISPGAYRRRGQDFTVETVDLLELVDGAACAFKPAMGRESPVIHRTDHGLRVSCDRRKLGQVMTNLISNAYKYSPAGGEVSISFPVEWNGDRRSLGVELRDHGIGMTAEQQAHCFERFYRADASGKIPGTGLGLCIVKEIMDLHGGRIDLESAIGQGTTVTIWLPEAVAISESIHQPLEA